MHEALRKEGGEPVLYHESVALAIRHVGYSSTRIRAKHERNLALMEQRIEEAGLQPGALVILPIPITGLENMPLHSSMRVPR